MPISASCPLDAADEPERFVVLLGKMNIFGTEKCNHDLVINGVLGCTWTIFWRTTSARIELFHRG